MTKEIVAHGHAKFKGTQKLEMPLRHRLPQRVGCFFKALSDHDRGNRHTIGMQCFESSEAPPLGSDRGIAQKCFEKCLMVAFESNVSGRKWIACQPVEYASRIRTPVHVVAQRYG